MGNLLSINIFAASFIGLFAVSEIMHLKLSVKGELTRKFVHIASGVLALTFPSFLNLGEVGFLCLSFLIILFWSKRKNQLKGINNIKRVSFGSELFPISVFISFLALKLTGNDAYYYLPIGILTFADPVAALMGKKYGARKWVIGDRNKSLLGSIYFFLTAVLCTTLFSILNDEFNPVLFLMVIPMASTISELFSKYGLDNIMIPLAVLLCLMASNFL